MSADVLIADTGRMDYDKFVDGFKAERIATKLSGDLDAGLNACVECCDRHSPSNVALFWQGSDGRSRSYTFQQLIEHSAQLAGHVAPGSDLPAAIHRIRAEGDRG